MSDTHKRLFDTLPEGARAAWLLNLIRDGGRFDPDSDLREAIDASIEHAAIVWLMGRATEQETELSVSCHNLNGGQFQVSVGRFKAYMADTLIDALLAAVELEVRHD